MKNLFLLSLAAIMLVACDDQNFDWEKARSTSESVYEQAFSELYGSIDPNQTWDFSYGAVAPTTRAGEDIPITAVNGLTFAFDDSNAWSVVSTDATADNYSMYKKVCGDGTNGAYLEEGKNQTSSPLVLSSPASSFTILPISTCGANMYDLYVKVGDRNPKLIFTKNWTNYSDGHVTLRFYCHNMKIDIDDSSHSYYYNIEHGQCGTCHGSGISGTCSTCKGTGRILCTKCQGYYKTVTESNCEKCRQTGYITSTYYAYTIKNTSYLKFLNGTGVGNNSAEYKIVEYNGNHYLQNSNGQYLYATNNGVKATANISDYYEMKLTCSETQSGCTYLMLGKYYLYVQKKMTSSYNLKTSENQGNAQIWTFTKNEHSESVQCAVCGGTGKITTTTYCPYCTDGYMVCQKCNGKPNNYTTCSQCGGLGEEITKCQQLNVSSGDKRAQMPGVKVETDDATAGLPVQIFMRIINTDGSTFAIKGTGTGNALVVGEDGKISNPTSVTDGTNTFSLSDLKLIGDESEYLYLGMDDGQYQSGSTSGDLDYNDLTLAIFGLSGKPSYGNINSDTYESVVNYKKRYMVEDMGYTESGSNAVQNSNSDIDFNDIVVDFEQRKVIQHTIVYCTDNNNKSNGMIKSDTPAESPSELTTTATIRALGGTWNFDLKVKDDIIFQKKVNTYNVKNPYNVQFNTSTANNTPYTFYGSTTPVTSLDPTTMYNTGYNSDLGGDGNKIYNTWIAKVSSSDKTSAINQWNAASNNISFVLTNGSANDTTTKEYNSDDTSKEVDFPTPGSTPSIVAFPVSKHWQGERVPVSKNWFNSTTKAVIDAAGTLESE